MKPKFKPNFLKYYELTTNWHGKKYYKLKKEQENTIPAVLEGIVNPNDLINEKIFSKNDIELLKRFIKRMKENNEDFIENNKEHIESIENIIKDKIIRIKADKYIILLFDVMDERIRKYIKNQIQYEEKIKKYKNGKIINNYGKIITKNEYDKLPNKSNLNNSKEDYLMLDDNKYIPRDYINNGSNIFYNPRLNPFYNFNFNPKNDVNPQNTSNTRMISHARHKNPDPAPKFTTTNNWTETKLDFFKKFNEEDVKLLIIYINDKKDIQYINKINEIINGFKESSTINSHNQRIISVSLTEDEHDKITGYIKEQYTIIQHDASMTPSTSKKIINYIIRKIRRR